MARPDLAEKDILNPSEAIEYFVLSRRKFYNLLNNTDGEDFLAYYGERKLILRVAFERYLHNHPELRRRVPYSGLCFQISVYQFTDSHLSVYDIYKQIQICIYLFFQFTKGGAWLLALWKFVRRL